MPRHFDHIDLRVPKLADVTAFYGALLPALGFSSRVAMECWFEGVLFGLPTRVRIPVVILLSVHEQLCSQHYLINAIRVEEERGGGPNLMRRSRSAVGAG